MDPHDRWAIVAYIRALQLTRHATVAEAPEAGTALNEPRPRTLAAGSCSRAACSLPLLPGLGARRRPSAGWLIGFLFWSDITIGALVLR